MTTPISCSFCGKSKHEVAVLVAGPTCFVCDQCVDLCFDIVSEHRESASRPWVERLRQAIDNLYSARDEEQDRRLQEVLAEPGADERLREAAQAARRIIGELREIRQEIASAEVAEKEKTR